MRVKDRVRFRRKPSFWVPDRGYLPPEGAVGTVTHVPSPSALGGALVVMWDDGGSSTFAGRNAESLELAGRRNVPPQRSL